MPVAFSPAADFSGMNSSESRSLRHVVHGASIEVDEQGTVATGVAFERIKLAVPEKLDHPFPYFIRDQINRSIVFVGRVSDPR